MAMKVLNEAIVGDYHFVVSDEYVHISTKMEPMLVHLSYQEAQEVIPWLYAKLSQYHGATAILEPFKPILADSRRESTIPVVGGQITLPGKLGGHGIDLKERETLQVPMFPDGKDPLANRSAKQTTPMKVGDPFLAGSAPDKSADGKFAVMGIEGTDLGAMAKQHGLLRK